MKRTLILALALLLPPALALAEEANGPRDAKLISTAKQLSVQKLDPLLPAISLEKWLRIEAGKGAQFHWEMNDCGEQSGSAKRNHFVPTCVEVDSFLKDGREIVIFLAKNAARDKPPTWTLFFAQLITPYEKMNLRQLSDFPAALIKTHELVPYPEIAK